MKKPNLETQIVSFCLRRGFISTDLIFHKFSQSNAVACVIQKLVNQRRLLKAGQISYNVYRYK